MKYLKPSEIEDLGFTFLRKEKVRPEIWFIKKDTNNIEHSYTLVYEFTINKVTIKHSFNQSVDYYTLFEGTIKTKSELKTIMEMVKKKY